MERFDDVEYNEAYLRSVFHALQSQIAGTWMAELARAHRTGIPASRESPAYIRALNMIPNHSVISAGTRAACEAIALLRAGADDAPESPLAMAEARVVRSKELLAAASAAVMAPGYPEPPTAWPRGNGLLRGRGPRSLHHRPRRMCGAVIHRCDPSQGSGLTLLTPRRSRSMRPGR